MVVSFVWIGLMLLLYIDDNYFQQWNETYLHFHKVDPKQTYYLSMEFLQGRALTNAIGNLNIQDAYADALHKFGLELEEIIEQVIKKLQAVCEIFLELFCHEIIPTHVKSFNCKPSVYDQFLKAQKPTLPCIKIPLNYRERGLNTWLLGD